MNKFRTEIGMPYPLGVTETEYGINFSMVNTTDEESGIILYPKNNLSEKIELPFKKENKTGNICCVRICNLDMKLYDYNFYVGNSIVIDPYAKQITGNEIWGKKPAAGELRGRYLKEVFDWKQTDTLKIPYSQSVFYCLHVRGFTKHESSKVKHPGTFTGIREKIPYLKKLGITAIELMPAYEFVETLQKSEPKTMEYAKKHIAEQKNSEKETVLNYWGYQDAYYFAPKASYAATENPVFELKELIRELHKNGIELIMQFYFPDSYKPGYIYEVMKYWVMEYRIDGVHLKGNKIPVSLIATEPLFANTKIMYHDFPMQDIYDVKEKPSYENLAYYRDEFMYDMRKYLKSDMDMLPSVQYHMKNKPDKAGYINFISNYYGFCLHDLVSYDMKHNEENGEGNQDGTDYNYSWNCGVEGETKKKSILSLRRKQIRNALAFVLLAQGTPLIMAGDEFDNTQKGNNNPYCQDNETTWLVWSRNTAAKKLQEYVTELIKFRKEHPVLHQERKLELYDTIGCGYPDLSYHGEEAWRVKMENYNRHLAFMYCGKYVKKDQQTEDDSIYIALNMYWDKISFALPQLPDKMVWEVVFDTSEGFQKEKAEQMDNQITIEGRCVCVLKSHARTKAGAAKK